MTVIQAIVSAWAEIMEGLVALFEPAQALFWGTEGFTFLGGLAIVGTTISIILLVVGIIQRFLALRSN